ncbi:DUF885 domain-containing protein [Microbulbifer aggregans]|uniref:DUF885 domain-containing protein n=1 Tax=Microbulbifer aggregans TaxID=1769779 RepID=UPI001CFF3DCF|nr:DUF885 domain-containing protein [Microbulbifer aggregans]
MRPVLSVTIRCLLLLLVTLSLGCDKDTPEAESHLTAGSTVELPAAASEPAAQKPPSESERLTAWLDARYDEELYFSPLELTRLGSKERYDEFDDFSEAASDRKLEWKAQTIADMQAQFDYHALDYEAKTSYDLWLYQYEVMKRDAAFRGNDYIFNQMWGYHTELPRVLISEHKVEGVSDAEAYISRISAIATALNQLRARAERYADGGLRLPAFASAEALKSSRALLDGAPFSDGEATALWQDFQGKLDALVQTGEITDEEKSELTAAAETALLEDMQPAYLTLIAWLEGELELAPEETIGASELDGGDDYYAHALALHTSTAMTAEEIHHLGLAEVQRIRREMTRVKKDVGFYGDLQDFFEYLRTDPKFFYPNTNEGREAYLEDSRAFLARIDVRLPKYFGLKPRAPLEVRRVEAFRERDGGVQHYYPPTPDGSRPGIYYAHLSDMTAYPKPDMETIAYHEGNPGHHMQFAIQQELSGIPKFRTQFFSTAYVEGWGLYAETLAREMGAMKNPYSYFGSLQSEMWRAVRLVVDTGLHAKDWSEDRAVEYFLANTSMPETLARAEVQRYLIWPGQATAYKVGMMKIQELRNRAQRELGEQFDIRGFHDTVLGGGALPLSILEARVKHWVDEIQAG